MGSYDKKTLLIFSVIICLFTSATCDPTKVRSCGSDLIIRVAKICLKRGGYNHLDYMRRKRNIIAECCTNPCPDNQLYPYCSRGEPEQPDDDVKVDIVY
ncbi:Bombyxin B-10 [Pseudolycoriella hygida]|uniref:Bombyxin B-10 n=1 Tax=Pseudolycoriella hygida TaxID=35572 RepID=A0A9Q0N0C1_9DIPT|nr:Bombyxin B-10 [Pseudolycoriella hygida]